MNAATKRLVACSGCGYSFWTDEDPDEWTRHCNYGRWVVDSEALAVPAGGWLAEPNFSSALREEYA